MTTGLITAKGTGLAKPGGAVKELATRIERARQAYNEKVRRADADYVEAVKRALASVSDGPDQSIVETPSSHDSPDPIISA